MGELDGHPSPHTPPPSRILRIREHFGLQRNTSIRGRERASTSRIRTATTTNGSQRTPHSAIALKPSRRPRRNRHDLPQQQPEQPVSGIQRSMLGIGHRFRCARFRGRAECRPPMKAARSTRHSAAVSMETRASMRNSTNGTTGGTAVRQRHEQYGLGPARSAEEQSARCRARVFPGRFRSPQLLPRVYRGRLRPVRHSFN